MDILRNIEYMALVGWGGRSGQGENFENCGCGIWFGGGVRGRSGKGCHSVCGCCGGENGTF